MKFEITVIDEALKYYEINDVYYRDKCYKCIKDVNEIEDFNIKAEEIYNILYTDKSFKIDTLWKRQNMIELFGELYNPYITNILVLYGYEIHCKNMKIRKYSKEQKELYNKRVKETLTNDIFIRKLEGIRVSQMIWAAYFINTRVIEVGRLQYEKCENYIKIHIPFGEKLQIDKVLDSIKNSRQEIEKYFNIKEPEYRCDSWLLSNQINDIIDKDSNIAKFYNLFDVKDGLDATKDILNFVFNVQECSNYNDLIEDTSLQKLLKQQLLKNKQMKIGCGNLNIYKT